MSAREPAARGSGRVLRATAAGIAALAVYGGWAAWANRTHGGQAMLLAGLAQGGMSLCSTFTSTLYLEWLFALGGRLFGARPNAHFLRAAFAAMGTLSTVLALMATVHAVLGTPEILATLYPVAGLGFVTVSLYAGGLAVAARRRARAAAGAPAAPAPMLSA